MTGILWFWFLRQTDRQTIKNHSNTTYVLQVTCKPMAGMIQERMKRLQDATVSDNVVLRVLANIGLGNHGILAA